MSDEANSAENWLRDHGDQLFRYARSRLRDVNAAEEVVQETFVAAVKHRGQYQGTGPMGAWLLGILKRKIVDYVRRQQREMPVEDLDNTANLFDDRGHWSTTVMKRNPFRLDQMESQELHRILNQCLDSLPSNQARAFVLREMDELTSESICQELAISMSNLWVLLHRARIRLAECITVKWSS